MRRAGSRRAGRRSTERGRRARPRPARERPARAADTARAGDPVAARRRPVEPVDRRQLGLSAKTIEGAIRVIFSKLGLEEDARDNRRVLAVLAYLDGSGPTA